MRGQVINAAWITFKKNISQIDLDSLCAAAQVSLRYCRLLERHCCHLPVRTGWAVRVTYGERTSMRRPERSWQKVEIWFISPLGRHWDCLPLIIVNENNLFWKLRVPKHMRCLFERKGRSYKDVHCFEWKTVPDWGPETSARMRRVFYAGPWPFESLVINSINVNFKIIAFLCCLSGEGRKANGDKHAKFAASIDHSRNHVS